MNKPFVKPVVIEPYFPTPKWIDNNIGLKEYIIISKDSSVHDVKLFLIEMFGYNNINVEQHVDKAFNDLLLQDEAVVAGGVLFLSHNKKIFPGCCCGLETWRDVVRGAVNEESPWMGHAPSPTFEFLEDKVFVWSDDYREGVTDEVYFIEYQKGELIKKLNNLENDLIQYAKGPLYKYMKHYHSEWADKMILKFKEWFDVRL